MFFLLLKSLAVKFLCLILFGRITGQFFFNNQTITKELKIRAKKVKSNKDGLKSVVDFQKVLNRYCHIFFFSELLADKFAFVEPMLKKAVEIDC